MFRQSVSLNEYKKNKNVRARNVLIVVLWELVSLLTLRNRLCIPSSFKRIVLVLFGAKIGRGVVIKQEVFIKFPWKLILGDYCWIGEGVWIDNISSVEIGAHVCLSQGAYICTGNHNWSNQDFTLMLQPVVIEEGVWVGAKAVIGPGSRLRSHSVVMIGSVVIGDTEAYKVYQGNPAVYVKDRNIQ